jgi:hypothetical protein
MSTNRGGQLVTPPQNGSGDMAALLRQALATRQQAGAVQPYSPPPQWGGQTIDVQPAVTEVVFTPAPTPPKPEVPGIHIPYTEIWNAGRLHPKARFRFLWLFLESLGTLVKRPLDSGKSFGIIAIGAFVLVVILSGLWNIFVNGSFSYTGPGYAKGRIEPNPRNLAPLLPVVDYKERE